MMRPELQPRPNQSVILREALLAMEDDLRTLQGVFAAYRIFAQSPDPIDPGALAVLAATGSRASDQLLALGRTLLDPHK